MTDFPATDAIPPAPAPSQPPLSDADYRRMVETVRDYAIFMLDTGGYVRSWNAGAERLKGYRADEIIGRHFSRFYPDAQAASGFPAEELRIALAHGRVEDEGWRIRNDGSRFWASVVITALFDDAGAHRGFVKVTRDLTERRQQEELLRQSEERFRLMVEGVRDYAIFMLDTEGRIASWNLGAEINKGYTASEIIGQHFSVFYPQELIERDWPAHELREALAVGRYEEEGWRLRKDGSRFWASVVITALFDPGGSHRGFSKVTRDLTDRRRIATLESQERHLHQFLALLGHELRNPLAPIANAVSLMQLDEPRDARMRGTRDILARQVAHLCRLVDDLLDVGRIVNGKVHLDTKPVHMQQVVDEALEAHGPALRARGQQLVLDITQEPLYVRGDHVRLVQVLGNLVHNAVKFSPDGARVCVLLRGDAARVELAVADDGPGIAQHDMEHIFKLFAQGDHDPTRTHAGLGIGLSLVKQMVHQHGGDVAVFSTGLAGAGVEFVVTLPRLESPAPGGMLDAADVDVRSADPERSNL